MGTIVHNASSGGYYDIVTDNGTRYYPVSLENYTIHDGMYVYIEGEPVSGQSSDHTKGIPIRLSLLAEYIPPDETAKITMQDSFSGRGNSSFTPKE